MNDTMAFIQATSILLSAEEVIMDHPGITLMDVGIDFLYAADQVQEAWKENRLDWFHVDAMYDAFIYMAMTSHNQKMNARNN